MGWRLKVLPSMIMNMTMLESIDLGSNELTSFSYNIGKLTNLQSLYLGGNQFTSIPRELSLLKNLTTLYMDGNSLIDISSVVVLKQIRYLNLSRNQITSVPLDIGKINQTLEILYLDDNKLTDLPKDLAQMSQLEKLYIRNNEFSSATLEAIKDMFADNTWTRVYY
jgi:Leucine-rich repeat (LRR) protein